MTGETPTAPSTFGRWQQPAALTEVGLLPPDPYPLEKILFCATCGQQFFGTHQPGGGARVPDGTPVTHEPGDTDESGGVRVYRTFCACRPGPLPANEVELRVYAETHVAAFGTDTVAGLSNADYALLAVRFFTRIELGPTVDNITFLTRI